MHEVSICLSIFTSLEEAFSPEELAGLQEIHLQVGVLSGIEPALLQSAFELVTPTTRYKNATLYIESVDVKVKCHRCQRVFVVKDYCFLCPECQQPSNDIVQGRELLVKKIVLEETEETRDEKAVKQDGR